MKKLTKFIILGISSILISIYTFTSYLTLDTTDLITDNSKTLTFDLKINTGQKRLPSYTKHNKGNL
jgi:hypothetical protein